jgi:hypothetical protein
MVADFDGMQASLMDIWEEKYWEYNHKAWREQILKDFTIYLLLVEYVYFYLVRL